MIERFLKLCADNATKTAFIVKNKKITYSQLLKDVYKMIDFFKAKNIKAGDKILLFLLPSYDFYVLLFACIYYGVNIVVPDSYKNKRNVENIVKTKKIEYAFCNNVTFLFKSKLPKIIKYYNISTYKNFEGLYSKPNEKEDLTVLTTFTSGTTGMPKAIERNYELLKLQIESISQNVDFSGLERVYASLPIYVLFVVFSGRTCVLNGKINAKYLKKIQVDTIIAPIISTLKAKGDFSFIKKVFLGGARIYQKEGRYLAEKFACASVNYVYGASECALIATTDLNYYLNHGCSLKRIISGIDLSLVNVDNNGVGVISVNGKSVISNDNIYISNDLGVITDNGLKIVGRSKYCGKGFYNYLVDEELLSDNPKVKRGFSLMHGNKIYFCYEGRITKKESGITYVKFLRLPMDAKHKTKLDYARVLNKILAKNK